VIALLSGLIPSAQAIRILYIRLEVSDPLSQALRNLRDTLRAKEQEKQQRDNDEFAHTEATKHWL
jgi:hypothetical protein